VPVDPGLLRRLVCPRHKTPLSEAGSALVCAGRHSYPVVEGVPVLLDDVTQTMALATRSLRAAEFTLQQSDPASRDPWFLDTLGISAEETAELRARLDRNVSPDAPKPGVDPLVSFLVGATNGIAYDHLIGKLREYPIPDLRLPQGHGKALLDIGCNWGRWSIAAARLGYTVIGIDPSLGAILAARRAAAQLRVDAHFVVADGRFLPFPEAAFDVAFSYSVIQHFSRFDASTAIREVGRVLRTHGRSLIQMPAVFGLRCIYHQARRRFCEPRDFEVRYWTIPGLRSLFTADIGPTTFSVDCFFGLGLQASDLPLMPDRRARIIRASEFLRKASRILPGLIYVADSVYVESTKEERPSPDSG